MNQKTTQIASLALLLFCSGALSQDNFQEDFINPSEARIIYGEIQEKVSQDALIEFVSPEVTEAIEWYIQLDDSAIEPSSLGPNGTPAAAAGGFAAGIVTFVYERVRTHFGSSPLHATVGPQDFDLIDPRMSLSGSEDKVTSTPQAVVGALTFAVGRDVARWVAKKIGRDDAPSDFTIAATEFDIY